MTCAVFDLSDLTLDWDQLSPWEKDFTREFSVPLSQAETKIIWYVCLGSSSPLSLLQELRERIKFDACGVDRDLVFTMLENFEKRGHKKSVAVFDFTGFQPGILTAVSSTVRAKFSSGDRCHTVVFSPEFPVLNGLLSLGAKYLEVRLLKDEVVTVLPALC